MESKKVESILTLKVIIIALINAAIYITAIVLI